MTPADEVIGRSVHERLPPHVAEAILEAGRRAVAEQEVQRIEYSMELRAEERDYEGRVVACGPDEFVLIVRDFTERTRQERVLERERDFSRAVVRSTPSFLALVDERGHAHGREPRARAGGRDTRGGVARAPLLEAVHRRGGRSAGEGGLRADARRRAAGHGRVRARRPGRRAPRRRLDRDDRARRGGRAPLPPVRARRDGPQAGGGGDQAVAGAHRLCRRRGAKAARAQPSRRRPAESRHRHALDPPRGPLAPHRPGQSRGAPRARAGRADDGPRGAARARARAASADPEPPGPRARRARARRPGADLR